MPWTVYAILIVFGLFVLLMIINPKLSCFGRKISSPLYPVMRKRKQSRLKTEDYGFSLVDEDVSLERAGSHLAADRDSLRREEGKSGGQKALKTLDYGFHLTEEDKNISGIEASESSDG